MYSIECEPRRRAEREAMERMALMLELEGWVREAQDRLDAELGAVMSVGREQRSYLKKASTSQQCRNPQKNPT